MVTSCDCSACGKRPDSEPARCCGSSQATVDDADPCLLSDAEVADWERLRWAMRMAGRDASVSPFWALALALELYGRAPAGCDFNSPAAAWCRRLLRCATHNPSWGDE